MLRRTLLSAVARRPSLFAADLVVLTLFLNPRATLARRRRRRCCSACSCPTGPRARSSCSLVTVLGTRPSRAWPRARRPPVEGLPWFTFAGRWSRCAAVGRALLVQPAELSPLDPASSRARAGRLAARARHRRLRCVLVAVGVDALLFPRRAARVSAALVVLAAASSVVLPLALRARCPARRPRRCPLATETRAPVRRVMLIGIDGLGPALRARRRGARRPARLRAPDGAARRATARWPRCGPPRARPSGPRSSPAACRATTASRASPPTACAAQPHGVRAAAQGRAGRPARARLARRAHRRSPRAPRRRARAVERAQRLRRSTTGVVRFWGTHPPERVQGFMLSHYVPPAAQRIRARGGRAASARPAARGRGPARSSREVDAAALVPSSWTLGPRAVAATALAPRAGRPGARARPHVPPRGRGAARGLRPAVLRDLLLRARRGRPRVPPLRASPIASATCARRRSRRYGRVVDRYASLLERVGGGDRSRALRPGDVLLVVSGYGMEPVSLGRRLLAADRAAAPLGGTHDGRARRRPARGGRRRPPGRRAARRPRCSTSPRPSSTSWACRWRATWRAACSPRCWTRSFARAHPITFIPSYESLAVTPVVGDPGYEPPAPLPDEP